MFIVMRIHSSRVSIVMCLDTRWPYSIRLPTYLYAGVRCAGGVCSHARTALLASLSTFWLRVYNASHR